MRILSGVIYWILVGVLTSVGVYASVFGNLFPYFLLAALVMAVLGAWRPGARYSWGALVGFGGLPALVFLANIIEGIRSAMNYPAASGGVSLRDLILPIAASCGEFDPKRLNPYCNPDPGTGEIAHPPEAGVVECSFVPGSYYVLFAIFTAITLLGVTLLYLQVRSPPRADGQQTRSGTVSGVTGLGAILFLIIGGLAFRAIEALSSPPEAGTAGLRNEPTSCPEHLEEEIATFYGLRDQATPPVETIGDGWGYQYASSGPGSISGRPITLPNGSLNHAVDGGARVGRVSAPYACSGNNPGIHR